MGVGFGPRFCLLKGERVADLSVTDRVHELVEPLLAAHDVEVVDVEQLGATLRVTVDRPGGIDLDAVSDATLVVSDALDRHDPIPGRYTLEVSSPGLERPLRTPAHFQRFVGSDVAVKTKADVEGERRVEGTLEAADDTGLVVAGRSLSYDDVEKARTVFVWEPAERGKAKDKAKAKTKAGKRRASTEAKRRSAAE
jgi:ribosome maturation factor RimP